MTYNWTQLKIDGVRPLNSHARKIRASYGFIDGGGEIVRLANGTRVSTLQPAFSKYTFSVSGEAYRKPAIDHLNKGDVVTIECPFYFNEPGMVEGNALKRPAADGSLSHWGVINDQVVKLEAGDPAILFTMYRPILVVMLDDVSIDYDEQNASCSWSLKGEEV